MPKGKDMGNMCHECMHSKYHGWTWTIAGLVILANALWPFANWWVLVGILITLKGLSKLMMRHPGN